ncbi:MAG: glutamate synthase-related protein [Candidatus Kryptoniota bacterium]
MNILNDISLYLKENEKSNCAIIANVKKNGVPSHGNVKRTLEALSNMGHRTGEIEYEGDGAGIQTDVPRKIWEKILTPHGIRSTVSYSDFFTVGHFFIRAEGELLAGILKRIKAIIEEGGLDVVFYRKGDTYRSALGPIGRATEPHFYQYACIPKEFKQFDSKKEFAIQLKIEKEIPEVHVVSFSKNSVVYKVRGDVHNLIEYYPELRDSDYTSAISLAHGRFSTNTDSVAERAQMFSTLGHNGEINTISRLRHEAAMLGMQLPEGGSDSQDLDRIIESLMFEHDFSLMEALSIVFPPVWTEIENLNPDLREMYTFYRRSFGSLAQGPAALICRQGDEVVFSVDAMGLRPLWFGETEKEYFASSEKGVVPLETMVSDVTPLAPGEKKGFLLHRRTFDRETERLVNGYVQVFSHEALQARAVELFKKRFDHEEPNSSLVSVRAIHTEVQSLPVFSQTLRRENVLSAFGWTKDETEDLLKMAEGGKETIGSMGYDGQLAPLSDGIQNLTEFFKETVAVVTNPAIDGIREQEHFSTRVIIGRKPDLSADVRRLTEYKQMVLEIPLIFKSGYSVEDNHALNEIAEEFGSFIIEKATGATSRTPLRFETINATFSPQEKLQEAVEKLKLRCIEAAENGAEVILLSDFGAFERGEAVIDPVLAVSVAYGALEEKRDDRTGNSKISLKRSTSIVVESGFIRNVHDIMIVLGLGASAVIPYMIFDEILSSKKDFDQKVLALKNSVKAIISGIEKVMSTMGIHEIEGYGKIFASLGLSDELQKILKTKAYLGNTTAGLKMEDLDREARMRLETALGKTKSNFRKHQHFNGKIWKTVNDVAKGEEDYQVYRSKLEQLEDEFPVALRHLLSFKEQQNNTISPHEVSTRIGQHSMPMYISAMSFGSQGETSFRSYAEGAYRLNTICINGEGGELEDILGRYYYNRGEQIASARFGVNARMLNSAKYLEIKIAQGAKPGEGGMLPSFKVTTKIAMARHTPEKIDLISPSNNHDIYSIEDLAQLIEELKTINPDALISVKIPSIPAIAPIATGVAKAGANIITISGYEGGTGAARKHSLRYVGFPAEIGVHEAHIALLKSGLRHRVELWCDGGMRSGKDVVKMMLLGADRVGFGTFAMLAIGCTQCRKCNTGTCHVGITSHFKDRDEAIYFGQKIFEPRDFEEAAEGIVRLFSAFNDEIKELTAYLGFKNVKDLVGRNDLLFQSKMHDKIDLSFLTERFSVDKSNDNGTSKRIFVRRPRTFLTRMIASTVLESAINNKSEEVCYSDDEVFNSDRAIGTYLAGELIRQSQNHSSPKAANLKRISLEFTRGVIPGNGLGAFSTAPIEIRVEGGAQDGVAKSASGGRIVILKGKNHEGELVDGSVGKYFAYGAQGGLFIVQGNADARAGIRLSGADVIIGGEVTVPIDDSKGNVASRANIKGFAFEYMTGGRALVMGDPGPWMCSGMTGGVVYFRINPMMNLTVDTLRRRLARNSIVRIVDVDESDEENLRYLLGEYIKELNASDQFELASRVESLLVKYRDNFVKGVPLISTRSEKAAASGVKSVVAAN